MTKSLHSFIDLVIEQKKLQFSTEEFNIDPSLVTNGVLKIQNNILVIYDYQTVSRFFLEKYKQKFNFSFSNFFNKNVEFINDIENDFNNGRFTTDYLSLEKEIWKSVVKEANNDYSCSFTSYLTSIDLDNKPEGIYQFIEAYSILLPDLILSEDEIMYNFLILADITKSDADYNIDLGNVLNGITKLSKKQYNKGLKLLEKSLDLEDRKEALISAIVTGLYENRRSEFFKSIIEKLILQEENRNPIFFGLSNISNLFDTDCKLFFKLIKEFRNNEKHLISVLSLVFSVLKSSHTIYHQFCFQELESAVENENAAYYILGNLDIRDIYTEEQTNIIIKLIQQNYFSVEKYIPPIGRTFWYLRNFESLKKVILTVIDVSPFTYFINKSKTFLYDRDKIEIDTLIIDLLTDNTASKRFIGLEIFHQMSHRNPYKFTFDILTLTPILQYKLWMALTFDFHQPKDRLTALIPLLSSESELIRESFLCKLEEISEDYGSHVLEVLEKNLDFSNPVHNNILERIKNYIQNFYEKNTSAKNALTELNPYNTHFELIHQFNDLFHKSIGKTIDKSTKENSFLSILGTNTIQLSKGGGWRTGTKKDISQLGSFGTSFIMPRSYFIDPNQYDMETGIMIRQNWKDEEFAEIIKIFENEQQ